MADETRINYVGLAHLHVVVDDLDVASAFYREVLGFVEMQSHHDLINRGLNVYWGLAEDPESLEVSLRFMALPGLLTLKLTKLVYRPYYVQGRSYGGEKYQRTDRSTTNLAPEMGLGHNRGLGPISIVVDDLERTYEVLLEHARAYGTRHKVRLLSPPTFLSPLLPHQTGATEHSMLFGQMEILDQLANVFPERAKFQMIDPFGVRWEFNNNVL